jgi:hypothetical protein
MAEDLAGSLLAIGVLPLVVWVPGYALAWLFDLFEFRRRTAAFRAAVGVPLSIAVCPIVTYLLGRFGSMSAVWSFYMAAAALVSILGWRAALRGRFVRPKGWGVFAAAALVWLGVALFSLIDWQIGNRLYYPANAFDYSLRAALTHSIGATGIPPQSPLFLPPGHPVALRYHYFWLLLLSLVNRMAPHWIGARQAEIAGTFWCGIGLMAVVASCLRLFLTGRPQAFRRRALVGILLLGITGLDIVPGLFLLFLYARGMMDFVLPSLESWNEYVDWFLHSSIWAPHAVAALIACITGFLLVWQAPAAANRRALLRYGLIGGMAFASAAGTSIWVAFVFGVFLLVWTAICAWKRWRREVLALAIAGGAALLLLLPYLQDLRAASVAGGPGTPGGRILALTVRTFSLAALIPHWPGMPEWGRLLLVNGSLLPLNYFLEFGFFFLIGRIKWRQYRASGRPLSRQDLACAALLAVSTLICTFLKSSVVDNNDLGWRGFLPAQFVLLLWSVDIWMERDKLTAISALQKQLLVVFIGLGAAGTAYDLAIARAYPLLADRGVLPPIAWMVPDRQSGSRNYAARAAYEWARAATGENAAIQFNPAGARQDTQEMLYADRRMVAADTACNTPFGGDPGLCAPIVARLMQLYPASGRPVSATVAEICHDLPIDLLIAKDTDAVWTDRESWVWTEEPLFANGYVRIFGCRNAAARTGIR